MSMLCTLIRGQMSNTFFQFGGWGGEGVGGKMTKMAPCPYMVKNFGNLLLQNRMSYDLETLLVASGTQALQS